MHLTFVQKLYLKNPYTCLLESTYQIIFDIIVANCLQEHKDANLYIEHSYHLESIFFIFAKQIIFINFIKLNLDFIEIIIIEFIMKFWGDIIVIILFIISFIYINWDEFIHITYGY